MKNLMSILMVTIVFGLVGYITSSGIMEVVACISGLLCVWLAARENVWSYPIGYVNVVLFAIMFYEAKLYADMTLQVMFGVLMAIGWYTWLTKRNNQKVRPTKKYSVLEMEILAIIIIGVSVLWGFGLAKWTDASIPYLDALIATISIAAQWLLSRKVFQNWYLWIIVNILSIGMYAYKDLMVVSFLYFVFLINAFYGLCQWKKGVKH